MEHQRVKWTDKQKKSQKYLLTEIAPRLRMLPIEIKPKPKCHCVAWAAICDGR